MFNTISWQAYWTAIAFITAGYYGVVFLLYFKKSTGFFLARGVSGSPIASSTNRESSSLSEQYPDDFSQPQTGSPEHLVYTCVDEINAFIQEARRVKTGKEEFLFSLKALLAKYPTIKTTEYKDSVTKVLISEAAHHCSIHLTVEEVDSVWLG